MSLTARIVSLLRSQTLSATRALRDRVQNQNSAPGRSKDAAAQDPFSSAGWNGAEASAGADSGAATAQDPELATYYANLEIPYGSNLAEVKSAWKRQVRRYHPDRFATDPERLAIATELLQGINHAHRELCRHLEASEPS